MRVGKSKKEITPYERPASTQSAFSSLTQETVSIEAKLNTERFRAPYDTSLLLLKRQTTCAGATKDRAALQRRTLELRSSDARFVIAAITK